MNVRLLPAAQLDATDAALYLEQQRAFLGDAFEAERRRVIESIGGNPRMYPRTKDGSAEPENREYFIARFKYRVIYAIWRTKP